MYINIQAELDVPRTRPDLPIDILTTHYTFNLILTLHGYTYEKKFTYVNVIHISIFTFFAPNINKNFLYLG